MWNRFLLAENLELELEKVEGKEEGEWIERKLRERKWIPVAQKQEWVVEGGGRREREITAIEIEIEIEMKLKLKWDWI